MKEPADDRLYNQLQNELRNLLEAEGLSQEQFANEYYCYATGQNDVEENELKLHYGRFKKLIADKADTRSPERIASYLRFFMEAYRKDGTHTPFDRDAAWAMYVELDTRIATQEFTEGDVKAAVASLSALFNLHREISKQYGHRCRRYYKLTNTCLNEHLRPFTSKYHKMITKEEAIDPDAFKQDLTEIQGHLKGLKDELFKIAE